MLFVLDINVLAYHITWQADKEKALDDDKTLDNYVKLNMMYLLSGAMFNRSDIKEARFIFVGDSKPYWRSEELYKLEVNYKSARSKNYRYKAYIPLVLTYMECFLAKNNMYVFYQQNYEADDIAALICSMAEQPVTLVTSDQDWIPLTKFQNVSWLSVKPTEFREINHTNNLDFFLKHPTYNATKEKRNFPKACITDLWKFKARFGDPSDSIPQDPTNSYKYLPYIDLLNPPKEYDLKLKTPSLKPMIKSFLSEKRQLITHEQFIKRARIPYMLAFHRVEREVEKT